MSTLGTSPPFSAFEGEEQVEAFVRRIAQAVAQQLGTRPLNSPFIRSTECAQILDITPEHLCAMRGRGEGPPWSGEGKWVRYERVAVLEWLRNLPRQPALQEHAPAPHHRRRDSG